MAILEMLPTEHISHTGDTGPRNIYDHFIIFPAEDKEAGGFPPHIYLFVCSHTLNITINDAVEC